jgi:hypothetical protein
LIEAGLGSVIGALPHQPPRRGPATFLIFAVLSAVTFWWVKAKVPETKGKPPERIQAA